MFYQPTPLEEWISQRYKAYGILEPTDLDEKTVGRTFNIYVYKRPVSSTSYVNGRFRSITVDERETPEKQRELFYHELCHVLRHVGWQSGIMPAAFRELQEREARHFVRYAAIPLHMLKYIDLDDPNYVQNTAYKFHVTPTLCNERFIKIEARTSQFRSPSMIPNMIS